VRKSLPDAPGPALAAQLANAELREGEALQIVFGIVFGRDPAPVFQISLHVPHKGNGSTKPNGAQPKKIGNQLP
jgi:hypothetical protein